MTKMLSAETRADMDRVIKGLETKSAKIRALAKAGYERADIARYLDIRYQHVRNVLIQDEARRERTAPSEPEQESEFLPVTLGPAGRIVIPAAQREALGLKEGDTLLLRLDGDELRVTSQDAAIQRVQRELAELIPPGVSLVDELLEERRREARREAGDA